jgi:hypothetical protein
VYLESVKDLLKVLRFQEDGGGLHVVEPVCQEHAEVLNEVGLVVIHALACKTMLDGQMICIIASHEGGSADHQGVIKFKHQASHQDSGLNYSLRVYHDK